jgi:Uma2 family endonuclease
MRIAGFMALCLIVQPTPPRFLNLELLEFYPTYGNESFQTFSRAKISASPSLTLPFAMYQYELPRYLPTADELPCSDDTPVDNELQEIIPSLLKSILEILWKDRMDWFFGIDMAIYTDPDRSAIVPDGFLSLNVERVFDEQMRSCYTLWEEKVPPVLVLEIVSATPGGEYTKKLQEYAQMGVLYYVIYNPKRRRKPTLEIHQLVNGEYELQPNNPLWMPEIGLGIGCERANHGALMREWVYWYDKNNHRYPTPVERAELADQRAERLAAQLRALGIEPD